MIRVVCVLIGYIFGLFQTSYIYGKMKGIDIRKHGSGNAGTTNTLRVMGKKAGAIVLFCDIMKTGLAMTLVRFLFYLHFKGGKGIACTAGLIIFFHPYMILPEVITFFGTFFLTHYVSLGSLLVQIVLIAEMIIFGQMGLFGMSQGALIELYIVTALLAMLAFWEHRANIGRLIHKTERKTYLSKKNEE